MVRITIVCPIICGLIQTQCAVVWLIMLHHQENLPSLYLQPDMRPSTSHQLRYRDYKQRSKRHQFVSRWPAAAAGSWNAQSLLWVMMFLFSTTFFPPFWNWKGISHIWVSGVADPIFWWDWPQEAKSKESSANSLNLSDKVTWLCF